jgi:glycerate 2-kinase
VTILIASDKFKGSLSAKEVCEAIRTGLLKLDPSLSVISVPLADGGEGTSELLTLNSKGSVINCSVSDPLFRKVNASYGISGDGATAFIEMASASGLHLLAKEERNPLNTTTYGSGELIADAIARGVNKIILAIGGSATNDAGIGMATALGMKFLDQHGNELQPIGSNLNHIHSFDDTHFLLKKKKLEVVVLCDVDNELYGPQGAAFVYGPQKGADNRGVKVLDQGLKHFAVVIKKEFNADVHFPGAGAAGGLGAGAKIFLNAAFNRGIDFMLKALHLEDQIKLADLVITGEGKMDEQTLSGKVVLGVTNLARNYNKPVVAIVGKNELSDVKIRWMGLKKVIQLVDENTSSSVAMRSTSKLITKRVLNLRLNEYF